MILGLFFLENKMERLLTKLAAVVLLVLFSCPLWSQEVPKAPAGIPQNFMFHKDTLVEVMKRKWPDIPYPSAIAGQIEQETCITLTHKKCWSRFAELKTSRERGSGLLQITTVYGRFDALEEVKGLDRELKDWGWGDVYNAEMQMVALLSMMKRNYGIFKSTNELDRYAFALAAYNGGIGGVQSDQRICRNTKGCDDKLWFGNVEHTSLKSKVKLGGAYSRSFFEINREYPVNILLKRRQKYKPFIDPFFEGAK